MHWQEAQKRAYEQSGTNFVFLPENRALLAGYQGYGWVVVTPERSMEAQTVQQVELVLEELLLPPLGWQP